MTILNHQGVLNKLNGRLSRIYDYLEQVKGKDAWPAWIPSIWNESGYRDVLETQNGELKVDLAAFISHHLRYVLDLSLDYKYEPNQLNLQDSVIYNSLVRYSTAWDYHHVGEIQSGTFLRLTILLPILKKMGVNILYLLPITRYSEINLKGDIGSPYAVQTLFDLDPNLHDPLLDGLDNFTIHDEMAALVEACHLLDIKVVLDFIPRVTARNSEFITEHPDWVYWIGKEHFEGFKPPDIPELGFFEECTPDKLETVYRSAATHPFLSKFTLPPNELNPELWESLKQRSQQTGEELLTLVEEEMGITTAPAHSDWINDVQPIWTDITFFKLYKDFSPQVRPYLAPDQAPYVMFDTIKCNLYPGEEPNRELWDSLINAIKFNLNTYGIDGFRIDIGHVLPVALLDEIVGTIKEIRPQAIVISEDLFNHNHRKAAATGYNIMLGSGWNVMTDISVGNLQNYLRELPNLEISIFACSETADTPRITSRGGVKLARMMSTFNFFLPNAIPYLTTGMEVYEEQPLNCGLGDNTNGADIPRAFFNQLKLNWSEDRSMIALFNQLYLNKSLHRDLLHPGNFFIPDPQGDAIIYAYLRGGELLVGCFNLNQEHEQAVDLNQSFPAWSGQFEVLIDSDRDEVREPSSSLSPYKSNKFSMTPNQAIILYGTN